MTMTAKTVAEIPELLAIWDKELNGMPATEARTSSKTKYWWKCDSNIAGHSYDSNPFLRIRANYKCPICNGRRIVAGINDLSTTSPDIAKQWHPTKNIPLLPTEISHGSRVKVWWKGECTHEWQATPNNRVSNNQGCAVCKGRQASDNYSLVSEYPHL